MPGGLILLRLYLHEFRDWTPKALFLVILMLFLDVFIFQIVNKGAVQNEGTKEKLLSNLSRLDNPEAEEEV